ncbi:hypothetical protein [Nocardia bovistercoris]|uniref:Uncharacterized protein n=1 Tax=Nocardia bovistercoris TaxID=2785916 RepID=A0A931N4K4_9NOCA|nr:hypothetical protein [Nocardia bovistercoris]MBH0777713.1 hypothetical protein [Nocardia bovistercoris]
MTHDRPTPSPEPIPGVDAPLSPRRPRVESTTAHRPVLLVQLSDFARAECAVDPGELHPDNAIGVLAHHHDCPFPCIPNERATAALALRYQGTSPPDPDELHRRLAELVREYLRRIAQRADQPANPHPYRPGSGQVNR